MEKLVQLCRQKQLYLLMFWMLLTTVTIAATRYVDPVNGNDEWNGLWIEHFPDTNLGPVATIETAVVLADWRDTIVLLDGIYAGPEHTGQAVFDEMITDGVHICSLNGPESCILQLPRSIHLSSNRSNGHEIIQCTFDGITFESDQDDVQTAISLYHIYLIFQNCEFRSFKATSIISNDNDVYLELKDCTFDNNLTSRLIQFVGDSSTLILKKCLFQYNDMNYAVAIDGAQADIEDCLFDRNNLGDERYPSDFGSSMIRINNNGHAQIDRCSFINNTCSNYCSFITGIENASVKIDSCIIQDNTAEATSEYILAGITCFYGSEFKISNTRIENLKHLNRNQRTYGIHAENPQTLIVKECKINNNSTGISCMRSHADTYSEVTISDTEFAGNTYMDSDHPKDGCGISLTENDHLNTTIERCTFKNNKNGIYLSPQTSDSFKISHCLFAGNEAHALYNYGIYTDSLRPVINCTFVDNPKGIYAESTYFKNCIIRNSFFYQSTNQVIVDYSSVEGGWTGPGVGNIVSSPWFVSRSGGDYHLRSMAGYYDPVTDSWIQDTLQSPCIDAGDPSDDVGDEPYGSGGRINMGFYGGTAEASKSTICAGGMDGTGKMLSDLNRDCVVDLADFSQFASEWLQSTIDYQHGPY